MGVSPTAAFVLSPFVPPDHSGWIWSLVGFASEVCVCVVECEYQARSDAFVEAHPNSVDVSLLEPPNSIVSLSPGLPVAAEGESHPR